MSAASFYGEEDIVRIGIHAGSSDPDQVAEQCRQAGVEEVFSSVSADPGYAERGYLSSDAMKSFIDAMAERGIRVSGMITPVPSKEMVLGEDEAGLENLCKTLRAMGEAGIETALFYPLDKFIYFKEYHPGQPLELTVGGEGWDKVIEFFRRVASAAEEVDLKRANHLWSIDMEHAILEAVPSPSNGVTYCQGMYIFGEDPHTPDETWGMDRIFFCHARNLIRHGPAFWEYEEVPLDKGDVDIAKCVRALMDAGYEGVMIPEHLGEGTSLAESVAYLKGLINL